MKFKDPVEVRCPACGHASEQSVDDLLARRAKCPECRRLLAETSEKMHRILDAWKDLVFASFLSFEIERQDTSLHLDDAVIEEVHSLQDLVNATAALLVDVPESERHASAVHAVTCALRSMLPQIPCPPLADRLADAFRPYWDGKDFWNLVVALPRRTPARGPAGA